MHLKALKHYHLVNFFNKEAFGTLAKWLPYGIMILFGCIYLTIVICNHYFFRTVAFDYGAYNFAFNDFAHLRVSDSPVYQREHMSFLQDHVSFTLILFIPLFWLLSWITGTYTLLLIQTFLIIYGAWAVYKLVKLKTNSELLSLLALLQYSLLLGRWTSFTSDCNLAIIASSMIPVFLLYFYRKKLVWTMGVFIFILASREDMAIWMAFIGIFLLVSNYKDKWSRYLATGIILGSTAYFIAVFSVIIPLLETPFKKFSLFNYTALGSGPLEALVFILKHPFETIKLLFVNTSGDPVFDHLKSEFYIYYLVCGGFLLFFRPKYLLLFIPILAKKMLNDDPTRWSNQLYYSIEFVSILPIAVFLIISEFKSKTIRSILTGTVCFTTLAFTIHMIQSDNRKMSWWGDNKFAFYKSSMYKADFDVKKINNYLKLIPADAKVSATAHVLPHLAFRSKIYYFPRVDDADYLVGFLKNDNYPLDEKQFPVELRKYLNGYDWKYKIYDYPFFMAERIKKRL